MSIVIAVISGIEISHNYLHQKVLHRPLRVCNCQRFGVVYKCSAMKQYTPPTCGLSGTRQQNWFGWGKSSLKVHAGVYADC